MSEKPINDNAEFLTGVVVDAMQDKKAENIVKLDIGKLPNAVADYFIICHAKSKIQVGAIYDNILEKVKEKCGVNPFNKEGYQNAEWILIDYIDVVVHVFLEETREFYKLEQLWGDAISTRF